MLDNSLENWKKELVKSLKCENEDELRKKFSVYMKDGLDFNALESTAKTYQVQSFPENIEFIRFESDDIEGDRAGGVSAFFAENQKKGEKIIIRSFKQERWSNSGYLDLIPLLEEIKFDGEYTELCSLMESYTPLINLQLIHQAGGDIPAEVSAAMKLLHDLDMKCEVHILMPHDSQLFLQIAKLRAIRLILDSLDNISYKIISCNSALRFTNFEASTNMLRNVVVSSAAMMGGADYLVLDNYQAKEERQSRNTYHVLKDESFLRRVQDPAQGSELIDGLTQNIIEKSLKSYDLIEDLSLEQYMSQLSEQCLWRANEIQARVEQVEETIVGVNYYSDRSNVLIHKKVLFETPLFPLRQPHQRIEDLRLALQDQTLKIGLRSFGDPKKAQGRINYAKNIFDVLGKPVEHHHIEETDLKLMDENALVICAEDEVLERILPALVSEKSGKVIVISKKVTAPHAVNFYPGLNIVDFFIEHLGVKL